MAIESQADQRRPATFFDQHERPWHASVEKSTGDPVGMLEPLFTAPWIPPQSAIRTIADRPGRLHIDYEKLILERQEALAEYNREALRVGREMFGSQFQVGEALPAELRMVVGDPPLSVVPVIAAMQGKSRWILLGEGPMPKWAEPHFRPKEVARDVFGGGVEYTDDDEAGELVAAPAAGTPRANGKPPRAAAGAAPAPAAPGGE